ncbi:ABC transporter substrate-binding protein [Granulosicoccus sp.]|nr:ABC transporter substrate-binding protein [Granulosicoccus sp.]
MMVRREYGFLSRRCLSQRCLSRRCLSQRCLSRRCLALIIVCLPVHVLAQEDVRYFGPEDADQSLLIRGNTDIDAFAPVMQAFVDIRDDLRMRYEQWGSNALYEKSDDECHHPGADADLLISSAIDQQVKLVNDGCAQAHRSVYTRRLPDHANWRDELFGITREPAVMVYNREELSDDEVPLSRFDLIDRLRPNDSRFAGRVATYDIEQSGLGYLFAFADSQQASTYGALLEAFGRTRAVATCCSAELIDAVAEGRFLVAYNVLGSYALARADIDPRIGVVAPQDYTLILSRAAMISKDAQHVATARAFLDFLLSDHGRSVLAESHLIAEIDDTDNVSLISDLGDATVLRPIPLSPTLLVGLDRMKRELFVRQWRENMVLLPNKNE